MPPTSNRIAVLGGGISGLTAAYYAQQRGWEVTVFEAEDRVGGVLRTERRGNWLLDHGADNFIVEPDAAVKLVEELGIADQLIPPAADDRRAFIVRNGRLVSAPEGLALLRPTRLTSVLTTSLLSMSGKLRVLAEPLQPTKKDESDESLAEFVRRRLGREFLDRIVQPLVGGIYTGDAEKLSVRATVPQVVAMERQYGSLLRGTLAQRKANTERASRQASGARYGQFRAFAGGSQTLVDALVRALPATIVRRGSQVTGISRDEDGRWTVHELQGRHTGYTNVVSALPGPRASLVLRRVCPTASNLLDGIPYASSAVVLFGVRDGDFAQPLAGFGFVVPSIEHREILSVSYASKKYPGRGPEGGQLLRIFIGGALQPQLFHRRDEDLIEIARREIRELLFYRGEPEFAQVIRWEQRMPQYLVGHFERVAAIRAAVSQLPGLAIIGNALDGVGIPLCVATAKATVDQITPPTATPTFRSGHDSPTQSRE
jgi:oxygen-dependent protoporphyrinogen oxidase